MTQGGKTAAELLQQKTAEGEADDSMTGDQGQQAFGISFGVSEHKTT